MLRYGKLARQAVSVMSYLAEKHGPDCQAVPSSEVAKVRKMSVPLAAKLLSEASSAGLTHGTTGPGGGYRLARPPSEISLSDIVSLFELPVRDFPCPYGDGWCGNGPPCPLHDDLTALNENSRDFLEQTTLEIFSTNQSTDG